VRKVSNIVTGYLCNFGLYYNTTLQAKGCESMGLLRLAAIIVVVGVSYRLLRIFIAGGICTSKTNMNDKTVIITGANTGIGKATALDLARRGAKVIMACRDLKRAGIALNDIVKKTGNSNVILKHLDLASMKSIRAFAEDINTNEAVLHVLINNAGVISAPDERQKSEDGLELTMAVNHLGHFLLTNLLLDLLRKSAPSRVVVVASNGHHSFLATRSPFRFDNMQSELYYNNFEAYGQSKLANMLFSRELARRLKDTGVTANSLHPGIVTSELSRHLGFSEIVANISLRVLSLVALKSEEEGAQTSIHLAVSEDVEGTSGKFFVDCKEKEPANTAKDDVAAEKLWHISAKLVGLLKV
jgi:light-dependent protochlorophyllide reductase